MQCYLIKWVEGGVDFPPCIQKVELKIFLFCKGFGKNISLVRNVFSSGPSPAINNERPLRCVLARLGGWS